MDVLVPVRGQTDLDDVGHAGEVHSSGGDIRGDQDGGGGAPEGLGVSGPRILRQFRVDVEDGYAAASPCESCSPKYLVGIFDGGGVGEEDNGLEGGSGRILLGLFDPFVCDLQDSREPVGITLDSNNVLGNLVVRGFIIGSDGLNELEVVGLDHALGQMHDIAGNSSREEKGLAIDLADRRK